jgi:hypothetical protein
MILTQESLTSLAIDFNMAKKQKTPTFAERAQAIIKKYPRAKWDKIEQNDLVRELRKLREEQEQVRGLMEVADKANDVDNGMFTPGNPEQSFGPVNAEQGDPRFQKWAENVPGMGQPMEVDPSKMDFMAMQQQAYGGMMNFDGLSGNTGYMNGFITPDRANTISYNRDGSRSDGTIEGNKKYYQSLDQAQRPWMAGETQNPFQVPNFPPAVQQPQGEWQRSVMQTARRPLLTSGAVINGNNPAPVSQQAPMLGVNAPNRGQAPYVTPTASPEPTMQADYNPPVFSEPAQMPQIQQGPTAIDFKDPLIRFQKGQSMAGLAKNVTGIPETPGLQGDKTNNTKGKIWDSPTTSAMPQLLSAASSVIGDIAQIRNLNKMPQNVNLGRMTAQSVDLEPQRQAATRMYQQNRNSQLRALRDTGSRTFDTTALSDQYGTQMGQSYMNEQNANAQLRQQAGQTNAGLQAQEAQLNNDLQLKKLSGRSSVIDSLANTLPMALKDYRQQSMDQQMVNMMGQDYGLYQQWISDPTFRQRLQQMMGTQPRQVLNRKYASGQ